MNHSERANSLASSQLSPTSQNIMTFKIVLIGDKSVGKTCLAKRYTDNIFLPNAESTIGAQFTSKVINIQPSENSDPVRIKLQIWDTAGEEKFRSITPMYYKNAAAVVLVYDITNEQSFVSIGSWVREIEDNKTNQLQLAVVANKSDKAAEQEVPVESGIKYAKKVNAIFMQTSAKDNEGISDLFNAIAINLYKKEINQSSNLQARSNGGVKITRASMASSSTRKEKGKCC